ncbi:hypothetical protein Q644_16540 [Brucella intermedia 229E]|uniref:ABC transporter permease n=1 Tax=Brucella intermedia 229E TaxID=1337887 RepID=U4VHV6_9HYPH|nr:hypothetical protein Q644_16540 [Brucella intermedia 229E]
MTDMIANTAAVSTQLKKNRRRIPLMVIIGFVWIAAMILIAVTADWIRPYNITAFDLKNRLALPGNAQHWLGTDELGRDVLSRLIESIRISLLIAFGATIISAVFGTTLGFLAAYFRGGRSNRLWSCWLIFRQHCHSSFFRSRCLHSSEVRSCC